MHTLQIRNQFGHPTRDQSRSSRSNPEFPTKSFLNNLTVGLARPSSSNFDRPQDFLVDLRVVRTLATLDARRLGVTVSEWVRRALKDSRRQLPSGEPSRKLAAVRAATRHDFPSGSIHKMLSEIERGYEDS